MAVGHLAAVGRYHLRLARLALLLRLGLLFHIGIRFRFGFTFRIGLLFRAFLTGRFILYLIRGRLDRLVLHGLVFLFLCHIGVGCDFFFYL